MKRFRPSPAAAIALVALAVTLGGTSYAAVRLPANSVGTAQLKANAVTSVKVKNGSLTRTDFKANQLPVGPAGPPGPTGPAGPPGVAGAAGAAGPTAPTDAYSRFLNGPIAVPTSSTTLTSLTIPNGGKYLLVAKAYFTNGPGASDTVTCTLEAGSDSDTTKTVTNTLQWPIELIVGHEYGSAGSADFKCTSPSATSANFIKISAIKVNNLTSS
jgi:hypothetical protein